MDHRRQEEMRGKCKRSILYRHFDSPTKGFSPCWITRGRTRYVEASEEVSSAPSASEESELESRRPGNQCESPPHEETRRSDPPSRSSFPLDGWRRAVN